MTASYPLSFRKPLGLLSLSTLFSFFCVTAMSQEKSQQALPRSGQEPPAVLKATTRLVTVDVVAKDRKGNAVRDLKADEFQVIEQSGSGKSQQHIATFLLLDRALAEAPDSQKTALRLPAGVYTNLVTTKSLSAPPTILLVDGLNTEASAQLQVRRKMVQLLASSQSSAPMAVFLLGRQLRVLQNFTTNTKLLSAAAQRALTLEATNLQAKDARDDPLSHSSLLEEMAGAEGQSDIPGGPPAGQLPGPGSSGAGGASDALLAMRALQLQRFEREQYAESVDVRVRMTLDALRVIARHVSGYPGRKNLIWLSSAFPLNIMPDANLTMVARFSGTRNYGGDMAAVASALTDAQVAVYPIDPRGMQTQALFDPESMGKLNPFSEGATLRRESDIRFSTQDSMRNLADQTGGQICFNNNDLSECVKRAIDDSSSYYELSYYPTDKNWRGEFRRILVKTTRPGVQLWFRKGYFARDFDSAASVKDAKDSKDMDIYVSQAACSDFLTSTSIMVQASGVPPDQPEQAKYFLLIDPNALSFGPADGGEGICRLSWQHACSTSVGCPFNSIAKPLRKKFQIPSFSPSNPTVSRTRFLWFPSQGPRVFACWFAIAGREWSVPWIFPIPRKLFPQPWLIRKRVLAKPQERPLVSLLVRLSFMARMDARESWNGAPTDCSIRVTCPPRRARVPCLTHCLRSLTAAKAEGSSLSPIKQLLPLSRCTLTPTITTAPKFTWMVLT